MALHMTSAGQPLGFINKPSMGAAVQASSRPQLPLPRSRGARLPAQDQIDKQSAACSEACSEAGCSDQESTAAGASVRSELSDGWGSPEAVAPEQSAQGLQDDAATPGVRRLDGEMIPVPPGLAPPPEIPSHGSTLHAMGQCRPCNWFWKPGGCNFGANCSCRHLCPATELKARKKSKYAMLRACRSNARRFHGASTWSAESARVVQSR